MKQELYEEIWKRKGARDVKEFVGSRTHTAAANLPPSGGRLLLDVGCGDGFFLAGIRSKFRGVSGIDFSKTAVDAALSRGLDAKYCNFSEEKFPFPDEHFDAVTCLDVIEHVFDLRFMMCEISRVLAPKGIAIISTPNIQYLPRLLSIAKGRFPRTSGDPEGYDGGHIHYFTFRNLEYECERVGLKPSARIGYHGGNAPHPADSLAKAILPHARYVEYFSPGIMVKAMKD